MLWVNDQQAWPLAKEQSWRKVLYDVTDDWTEGFGEGPTRERIEADDREMCRQADEVIVCSERLRELKIAMHSRVSLIPNGVDVAAYAKIDEANLEPATRSWRAPVLGYTGSLHPERLNVRLLEELAQQWQGTIALVGPNMLGGVAGRLSALSNVQITGAVPYSELPGWMRAMDVMIVPHLVSRFTDSLNPLKLWEYLAAGRPIVSTPVAGFRDYPQHVRLADDVDSFLTSCLEALDEPADAAHRRQSEASEHGWDRRIELVKECLETR